MRDEKKQKQYLSEFRKRHKSMSGFEMVLDKLQMPVKGGRLQREIGYKAIAFPTRHLASLLMWLKSPEFMCWFFENRKGTTNTQPKLQKFIKKDKDAQVGRSDTSMISRYCMFLDTSVSPTLHQSATSYAVGIPLLNTQNIACLSNVKETVFDSLASTDEYFYTNRQSYYFCPGVVGNVGEPGYQMLHVDHPEEEFLGTGSPPAWIVHMPLCSEGLALQVCLNPVEKQICRQFIYIPFGQMLILRSDIYHSGHFGGKGNMRFHAVIAQENRFTFDRLCRLFPGGEHPKSEKLHPASEVIPILRKKAGMGCGLNRYATKLLKEYKGNEMRSLISNHQFSG